VHIENYQTNDHCKEVLFENLFTDKNDNLVLMNKMSLYRYRVSMRKY